MTHAHTNPMAMEAQPTVVMPIMQISQPNKQTSCCLIFTAVLLLLASAGTIGGGGYIASQSKLLSYHYFFLASGGLSFLVSILALYAGQDVQGRRGWVIAASAFAIGGVAAAVAATPVGLQAVENKDNDCVLPKCDIKPNLELSTNIKDISFSGVKCGWQCFDNYITIWHIMLVVNGVCGALDILLFLVACCQCLIVLCCQKKRNNVTYVSGPALQARSQTVAYDRLEN